MATKNEHPERYGWWLNELESLGISTKRINDVNDLSEISNLTENIKQAYYRDYKLLHSTARKVPIRIVAKTSDSREKDKLKVTYAFVDSYHSLRPDKKDILAAEVAACERLLRYTLDESDKKAIESELVELSTALDDLT